MGAEDFAWADGLRRAHFPPERNKVPAHISLFHHLPPTLLPELSDRMKGLCAGAPPLAMITGVMLLGRGVAFDVRSDGLLAIRDELAEAFRGLLTPQDQARARLHITVQNKVEPSVARALADQLKAEFRPRPLRIVGLAAWHYRDGGSWDLAKKVSFRSARILT
ncbi:2'-5' RNA ligase family protein [Sphingobium sp. Cam5-1]|uniref:2'-5' RNA ligase family protein n=1 Tax=Sphingobium sp. Cam5-1 TaxID=2789327 RepID=UPI0018AD21EB|nr:2'-5' RNA ligase family protein [Sphingobium sp. Cam5-1]QPI73667.1 2'-5' RNA ligase family protein [Sphingobium sp. Cam5-1]